MGKISRQIVEDTYAKRQSTNQELSILIGMDSFAYIITGENREVEMIREFEIEATRIERIVAEIQTIIDEDKPLNLPYKRIRMAYTGSIVTIVPDRLYDREKRPQYLQQLTQVEEHYEFRSDRLETIEAQNVYALEEELGVFLRTSYPGTLFFHLSTVLFNQLHPFTSNKNGYNLFVNVRGRNLNIFLFQKDTLVFSNSFQYQASKDFVYFIMLVFDQFELDSHKIPIYLSGQIIEQSEIYKLLFRYVKHIQFLPKLSTHRFGAKLQEIEPHLFFDLISLAYQD